MDLFQGSDLLFMALGVPIGVAAAMLILSLMVTGIVQFIQSLIGLRTRNLQTGIALVFQATLGMEESVARASAKKMTAIPAASKHTGKGGGVPEQGLFSPRVTWIEPAEIAERMRLIGVQRADNEVNDVMELFDGISSYMRKRFLMHVRAITVVCSFVVAFFFQVSTLDLIVNLSVDPDLRARYMAQADVLLADTEFRPTGAISYEDVANEALEKLKTRHPDAAREIEEASGRGGSRETIVRELSMLFEDDPQGRGTILTEEYGELLDELHAKNAEKSALLAREAVERLAVIDIGFWDKGWSYYGEFENILGVFLTGLLLSFGAPFWFDRLREFASLKDQLQPSRRKDQEEEASG
ncbi:MAG TPA: hypothetical protein VM118_04180 [Acidobacteriota bacterium]|nr:hypothetical protein [Acidobacteriota bacterium]